MLLVRLSLESIKGNLLTYLLTSNFIVQMSASCKTDSVDVTEWNA